MSGYRDGCFLFLSCKGLAGVFSYLSKVDLCMEVLGRF